MPENAPAWVLAILLWLAFVTMAIIDIINDKDKRK